MRQTLLLIVACGVGLMIAYIDSRPNWDDTAVTVFALCLFSALFAALEPRRPWLWALAVAGWNPLFGLARRGDPTLLVVLLFGLVGAYIGRLASRVLCPVPDQPSAGQ